MGNANRRDFIKAAGVIAVSAAAVNSVHAAGSDTIKVGLIGCGGRGGGAIRDCLSADHAVRVHAVGDVFEDRAQAVARNLANSNYKDRTDLTGRVFTGLDAYRQVIDSGVDMIILATPPGFRPIHLEAAIKAGKHVFTEKPVAVDGPGIRRVLALVDESKKKGLAVGAGTQRRHQKSYQEVYKFIQDGGLGDIIGGRCSWNGSGIWFNKRDELEASRFKRKISEVEYQLANWYHFCWLCGDHYVEQHVHNIDVINWFTGMHPSRAVGMGGRIGNHKARPAGDPKDVGNIFDHFAVEFQYQAKGEKGPIDRFKISSFARHYPGPGDVSEMVIGTKGIVRTDDKQYYQFVSPDGKVKDLYNAENESGKDGRKKDRSPYELEHVDLIQSIKAGKPINELQGVAESTLSALLGRNACYTGESLTWDRVLNSKTELVPANLSLTMNLPVPPTPVPGVSRMV